MTQRTWQPPSAAPIGRLLLVVYSDRRRALSWRESLGEGFSQEWWVHQRKGYDHRLGKVRAPFPAAWMEIEEAPSAEELEGIMRLDGEWLRRRVSDDHLAKNVDAEKGQAPPVMGQPPRNGRGG